MDTDDAQQRSALAFGNRYFASVVDAAARQHDRDDAFSVRRIARDLGVADSLVRSVVLRLAGLGIIDAVPRTGGSRSEQLYVLIESERTDALVAAARVTALGTPTRRPKPSPAKAQSGSTPGQRTAPPR
jgi:hypothetical protein